jgi:hypothetical protein
LERAEASTMRTFLEGLVRTYGGAAGWARSAGLGDDIVDALRDALVERPAA